MWFIFHSEQHCLCKWDRSRLKQCFHEDKYVFWQWLRKTVQNWTLKECCHNNSPLLINNIWTDLNRFKRSFLHNNRLVFYGDKMIDSLSKPWQMKQKLNVLYCKCNCWQLSEVLILSQVLLLHDHLDWSVQHACNWWTHIRCISYDRCWHWIEDTCFNRRGGIGTWFLGRVFFRFVASLDFGFGPMVWKPDLKYE